MLTVSLIFFGMTLPGLSCKSASANGGSERNAVVDGIVAYLEEKHVDMKEDKLKAVVNTVCDEAQLRDLDYRLALAVIKVESNFKQDVVSEKGAEGLFQIMPSLARYIAKDAGVKCNGTQCLREPDNNIKLGVYHLSKLVGDFESLPTALHAYNVGTDKAKARDPNADEPKTEFTKRVLREYTTNISCLPGGERLKQNARGISRSIGRPRRLLN
jgi:soluble lytic murein transglycosylase